MKKGRSLLILFYSCILLFNCIAAGYGQNSQPYVCKVDISKKYQVIENFGASDCWSAQFVGNWPDTKKNAIADLLFSRELDANGKPKGIGLSLWRFNIGAGSAEQGKASNIQTEWRRTECFMNPDGTYNWNKQAGQQWFLKAAQQRGVQYFLGFTNSPPVFITQNGLAFNKDREETYNLKPDKYDAYADFLTQVLIGIEKNTGVKLNYIAPFNEPEWDWRGNGQEGSPALNSEIAKEVRLLDKKLTDKRLDTKIIITESGQLDYLYKSGTNKPGRDNQVEELFGATSANFIGNLNHVPKIIAGHAYWTVHPVTTMIEKRKELNEVLKKKGLNYWQTEVCLMEDIPGVGNGNGRDLTMKTALVFARLIHHDMVISHAAAWHWWLAISKYDYKDGLIYVNPQENDLDGEFFDSKLLWVFGNFSRFIRPGTVRVDVNLQEHNANDPEGIMISAYHNATTKEIIVVAVNYANASTKMKLEIPGIQITKVIPYITSDKEDEDLLPYPALSSTLETVVPEKSVVTYVCDYLK
jgi:O-glycosyl hydrolase